MGTNDSLKARFTAAQAVADGRAPNASGDQTTTRFYENLDSIARLSRAFAGVKAPADGGPESFTWGHLDVQELIGRGSFGRVYRALDTVLHREVALKLRDAASEAASGMDSRAYIQEARRLARVRHPNVLAVHGADVFNQRVGIWTDLLQGETLKHLLDREARLSPERVLEIGLDLARALEAIHANGVVHGDVKPANIMIEPDRRAVLMDFGAGGLDSGETRPPRFGTIATMGPELLEDGKLAASGDLYALGAVLYRMLTGDYPGRSRDLAALARTRARGDFRPVDRARKGLPTGLADLVGRLLAPDPGARPAAARVVADIEHIRGAPARRRRRLALAAVIGSLAVGVLVATAGYFEARRSQVEAQEARVRAESINQLLLGMMEQVAPLKSPGGTIEARALLDAGRQRLGQLSDIAPRTRANLLRTLADLYMDFEVGEQADQLSAEALEATRRVHGARSPQARRAGRIRARALLFLGEHEKALALLDDMLADTEGETNGSDLERARTLRQRGTVATRLERFDRARADLQAARALVQSLDESPVLLRVAILRDLSFLDHYSGEYESAKTRLKSAIALLEGSELSNERFHLAGLLKARARLARDADGDLTQQEALQRQALAIYRDLYDHPTKSVATAEYELGAALYQQEKHQEALPYFRRALEIYRDGGHLEGEATTALMLAKAHKALGEYGEARRFLDITEHNYRDVYGDAHSYMAMLLNERARLELDDDNASRAEALALQALDIYRATMGDDHPVTATANKALGRALLAQGKLEGARKQLEHTLGIWLERFGENDWRVADARHWLGALHLRAGETAAGRRQLEMALAVYAAEPERHPNSLAETRRLLTGIAAD